jgi:hypothetical protein
MRKAFFIIALGIVISGCKSTSITNTKLDRHSQVEIKGNWTLISVDYPSSDYIKINSFQIADSNCFEGSSWKFISNNNKGEFTLNNASCSTFSSAITWFINNDRQFVLKILDAGLKAKKVRSGFVLTIANQSQTQFQLIDKVDIGGKMTSVIYQFQKN